ncbi:DNA/RNA nuclease SfsA [Engelhardtia mirabilis]
MRIDAPLLEGRFQRRYKRFFVDVELDDGSVVTAHCPNTGSLKGCLVEGAQAWLRDSQSETRKLRHTFQAIKIGRSWVNVDTGLPNKVVRAAVEAGQIPELTGYASVRPEVKYGTGSRIDLLLEDDDRPPCYVEIKNTTLAEGRTARFPDAVTSRGLKHLGELTEVVRQGMRAVQFFFISRADVDCFRPADDIDPAYCAGLRAAAAAGVEVLAYSSQVRRDRLAVAEPLEVLLD